MELKHSEPLVGRHVTYSVLTQEVGIGETVSWQRTRLFGCSLKLENRVLQRPIFLEIT